MFLSHRRRLRWVQRRGLQRNDVRQHGPRRRLRGLRVRLPVKQSFLRGDVEADHADVLGGQALEGLRRFWRLAQSCQLDHRQRRTPQECFMAHGQHPRAGGQHQKLITSYVSVLNAVKTVYLFDLGAHSVAWPQKHWMEGLHSLQVASHPQTQDRFYQVNAVVRFFFVCFFLTVVYEWKERFLIFYWLAQGCGLRR